VVVDMGAAVSESARGSGEGLSLLHGWLPATLQCLAALAVAVAVAVGAGWWITGSGARDGHAGRYPGGRWAGPVVVAATGLVVPAVVAAWMSGEGLASDPPSDGLWVWLGLAGVAMALVVVGWGGAGWRRSAPLLAAVLAVLSVGLELNQWVGYFPTVHEAWGQLTAAPLPDQVDPADPAALRPLRGARPATGRLVPMTTPDDISHFDHRTEYVYLPPAWFAEPRPVLPALLMVGGEFSTPTDWVRTGKAVETADAYARAHGGFAPILVFADATGSFRNDTECVDGPRGNAATHLTDEVRPYVVAHFGASGAARQWAAVGWSTGGTCAVDLGLMHPELWGTFADIQGDLAPNAGDHRQTLARLYGGNAAAMAAFEPTTVLARHAPYPDSAGWFADSPPTGRPAKARTSGAGRFAGPGGSPDPAPAATRGQQATEAATLCAAATARHVDCAVHLQPGTHTWQFAAGAFATALPWLTGRLTGTAPAAPPPATPAPTR
jgi:S-formylglutathione hydrolase FrmB